MIIGGRDFNDGHTHVMGILNVTPDSFSDGGKYNNIDAALLHTKEMIEDGAHIIDIGGESTRPGYTMISDEEEIERVCPVIEKIKNEFDIPVSVDTYKSRVASAAITSGADLINDIWGLKYDDDMAAVISQHIQQNITRHAALCITGMKPYMMIFKKILSGICRSALQLQRKPMYPMIRLCWTPAWDLAKNIYTIYFA